MDNIKEELENKGETVAEGTVAEQPGAAEPTVAQDASLKQEPNLKEELGIAKDKYLRLYSEFENFRRRTAKEKLDMIQSANEQLIKALLPVMDDFERAEKSFKEKNDKDAEGFFLIENKFKKVLESYGVRFMEIQPGAGFDTDKHEAITQVAAPEEKLKGKVVDVVERGYLLNDKVIRFAKVVVGS